MKDLVVNIKRTSFTVPSQTGFGRGLFVDTESHLIFLSWSPLDHDHFVSDLNW